VSFSQNEVATENARRKMEEASKSPVGGAIENAVSFARPGLALASAVVGTGASTGTGLAVAGSVVAGFGIVDWFRRLGTAKVNENLELLGQATEDALNRVERVLLEHGTSIDEIRNRLNSHGFKDGMATASLQALRTTQNERLKRLALILSNSVKEDDLGSEDLDDMMRAAVELTEWDIFVLRKIYETQKNILVNSAFSYDWTTNVGNVWTEWGSIFGLRDDQHLKLRPALSRLQSLGLIAEAQTNFVKDGSLARQPFGLLLDGKKFYERLQEIAM
jgi:hypothetical protein